MIVRMSHLTVLCTEGSKEETLSRLRDMGVLHVSAETAPAQSSRDALAEADKALSTARAACETIKAIAREKDTATGGRLATAATPEDVMACKEACDAAEAEVASLEKEIALYSKFGDFDPAKVSALAHDGIPVTLFISPAATAPSDVKGAVVKILSASAEDKTVGGAVVGGDAAALAPDAFPGMEIVPLPTRSLSDMRAELASRKGDLANFRKRLASFAGCGKAMADELSERQFRRDFCAAAAKGGSDGGIAWITGFCPKDSASAIRAAAAESGWGIALRDPRDDENPPTLLRPPRLFRPIVSFFKMLDIAPGYREDDVSVVFYSFFTIFFAMLVGDFGYGFLMLAATVYFRFRFPKAKAAPFILLTVFSLATCVWGVLTCNYFGVHPAALDFSLPRWLNDPSYTNIMQLCFFLGAVHLTVARLWNAAMLCPDSKALAEIGWAGVVWTMYCTACAVVIPPDKFTFPHFMFWVAPVSILLIFLFMLKKEELKTEGVNLAILPLNIVSCLGDIISYVRLFAVGLAAVKVAENFNSMALSMNIPMLLKIPLVVAILAVGHGLNIAMGALSILVHGVRLNTLEFSNHKGISWSGYAYDPLRGRN